MSNDDIVKRLLGGDSRPGHLYDARCPMCDDNRHKVGQQAADEIERLRAENAALRAAGDRLADALEQGEWITAEEWQEAIDAWREVAR